jgi:hypothetical protein
MAVRRCRSFLLPALLAVLTVATTLAACGTQGSEAGDACPWYETGSQCSGNGRESSNADGRQPGVLDPSVGRIAMSADGNQHDEDDWASSAMALAILAQRNLQPNLVHYDYNDHIWDSDAEHLENMTESVLEGGKRFHFDTSRFFDDSKPEQLDEGTQDLVSEINASSSDDELWLVLAGPMETAWMALDKADPEHRKNVKCVSHGEWNETHGKKDHGGHDYEDLIDLGCQRFQIPDQNSGFGPTDMDDWDYLMDGDENLKWLHSRLELTGKGDVSDAGMIYYVVTGDKKGNRSDLRKYFDSSG